MIVSDICVHLRHLWLEAAYTATARFGVSAT